MSRTSRPHVAAWVHWRVANTEHRTLWKGASDHWVFANLNSRDLGIWSNRDGSGFHDTGRWVVSAIQCIQSHFHAS